MRIARPRRRDIRSITCAGASSCGEKVYFVLFSHASTLSGYFCCWFYGFVCRSFFLFQNANGAFGGGVGGPGMMNNIPVDPATAAAFANGGGMFNPYAAAAMAQQQAMMQQVCCVASGWLLDGGGAGAVFIFFGDSHVLSSKVFPWSQNQTHWLTCRAGTGKNKMKNITHVRVKQKKDAQKSTKMNKKNNSDTARGCTLRGGNILRTET